jgi:Flp pilus assembly pilin Flp
MYESIVRFMNDDKGLETIEYALMAALVVAAIATAVAALATAVTARFTAAKAAIT